MAKKILPVNLTDAEKNATSGNKGNNGSNMVVTKPVALGGMSVALDNAATAGKTNGSTPVQAGVPKTTPSAVGGLLGGISQPLGKLYAEGKTEVNPLELSSLGKTGVQGTAGKTPNAIGGLLGGMTQPLWKLYDEGKAGASPLDLSSLGGKGTAEAETASGKNTVSNPASAGSAVGVAAGTVTGNNAGTTGNNTGSTGNVAGNTVGTTAGQYPAYDYKSARDPFQESEEYRKAMEYTNSLLEKLNGGRTRYSDQIDELMGAWKNRAGFSYDVDSDPLFQQMLAEYTNAGKLAMQDTMGQAAALTGGYGSTYATAAGNAAYNQYLQGAYQNLPQYYGMALDAYNTEGDNMLKELALLQNADATEYERLMNEYSANAQAAQQRYQSEYGRYMDGLSQDNWEKQFDYGVYQDALAQNNWERQFNYGMQQDALAQNNWERQFNYGMQQDALAQNNWEKQFNYGMQQDALAQDKWEKQFNYGVQQDKQAQENWEKNFAYQKEQDAQAQKNYESDLAYNQYVNELKYLNGGSSGSGSSSEYKVPTEKMFSEALAAAVKGGEGGFLAYGETIPAYDEGAITEYVQNRTTFTKTKDTLNGFWGVDNNDVVVDGYGKAYTIKELADELGLSKAQQKQLTKLKKGETVNLSGVELYK